MAESKKQMLPTNSHKEVPLITTQELKDASEGTLLKLCVILHELFHPGISGREDFRQTLDVSMPTLDAAMKSQGFIGTVGWMAIQRRGLDRGLYKQWCDLQDAE